MRAEVTEVRRYIGEIRRSSARGGAAERLEISVPPAKNPRFIWVAVLLGVPWLLAVLTGSLYFLIAGPIGPFVIRIMALIVGLLMTVFIHIAAAISVWAAAYQAVGQEVLMVDSESIAVVRTALGVTLPARVVRREAAFAEMVPDLGRRHPQPKIEVRTGKAAVRFGSGISWQEAAAVRLRIEEYFETNGRSHIDPAL